LEIEKLFGFILFLWTAPGGSRLCRSVQSRHYTPERRKATTVSDETVVTVVTPEPEAPEVAPDTPDVVVVEAPAAAESPVVVETAIDHEGRLVRVEDALTVIAATLEEIRSNQAVTESHVEMVEETAQVAIEIAAEAAEESQAAPEEDEEPAREHFFFRPAPWKRK
jgi:hypothetical protein